MLIVPYIVWASFEHSNEYFELLEQNTSWTASGLSCCMVSSKHLLNVMQRWRNISSILSRRPVRPVPPCPTTLPHPSYGHSFALHNCHFTCIGLSKIQKVKKGSRQRKQRGFRKPKQWGGSRSTVHPPSAPCPSTFQTPDCSMRHQHILPLRETICVPLRTPDLSWTCCASKAIKYIPVTEQAWRQ